MEQAPAFKEPPRHISVTQVQTYLKCPARWGYTYLYDVKRVVAWPLIAGSAMDHALNELYRGRAEGKDPTAEDLEGIYEQELGRLGVGAVPSGGAPITTPETYLVGTRALLRAYLDTYARFVVGAAVQNKIEEDVPDWIGTDQLTLVGYIDLIRFTHRHQIIADHKFVSYPPRHDVAKNSFQLRVYDLFMGDSSHHVEIVSLIRGKKPKVLVTPHFVTQAERDSAKATLIQVGTAIARRELPMIPEGSPECKESRCPVWSMCRGRAEGPLPLPQAGIQPSISGHPPTPG
jgi:hypothetical protein